MYTLYNDHLTWQQTLKHEWRDRINYKFSNEEKSYDLDYKEKYLERMDSIKLKTFYGKHPTKYMGDT